MWARTLTDTADKLEVDAIQRTGLSLMTAIQHLALQAEPRPVWRLYLPNIQR